MKILIVSEFMPYPFIGGLARHAINLGNQLIKEGHTVDILGNGVYGADEFYHAIEFKGTVYLDKDIDRGKLVGRIERHLKIYPLWVHIRIAKKIAKSIMKYAKNYDAVHYHGHYPIVAKYIPNNINLIITHHDYSLSCPKKTLLHNNGRPCVPGITSNSCGQCHLSPPDIVRKRLNMVFVNLWRASAKKAIDCHKHIFVSKRLSDLNLSIINKQNSNVYMVHNFIDCASVQKHINYSKDNYVENKKIRVIFANNIDPLKGIKEYLETAMENDILTGDIEHIVAGDGIQKKMLEVKYRKESVKFTGHITYPEVINTVHNSDIYILPSIWEESCSTGVLEGLYLNKDVRALKRGGTPELVMYSSHESQLKLYDDMESLVLSIKQDPVYRAHEKINIKFNNCVSDKASEILGIYKK